MNLHEIDWGAQVAVMQKTDHAGSGLDLTLAALKKAKEN